MKLSLPVERRAYRLADKKGDRPAETAIPAGTHEFVEIPNPDGGTSSQPWLVLAADQKVGLAKSALLMTPGLTVVPERTEEGGDSAPAA